MVSVVDQYFLIKYVTYEDELNPIGQYLLKQGGIPLFASAKMLGTVLALCWLVHGYHRNIKFTLKIMIGIAVFQLWLLAFLFGIF
jgi:hypothetical protein